LRKQCAGAAEFYIIRMCTDSENVQLHELYLRLR
jgi:hypothetical protein